MKFHCLHCNQWIEAREELAGQIGNCPSCDSQFVIPAPPVDALPLAYQPGAIAKPGAKARRLPWIAAGFAILGVIGATGGLFAVFSVIVISAVLLGIIYPFFRKKEFANSRQRSEAWVKEVGAVIFIASLITWFLVGARKRTAESEYRKALGQECADMIAEFSKIPVGSALIPTADSKLPLMLPTFEPLEPQKRVLGKILVIRVDGDLKDIDGIHMRLPPRFRAVSRGEVALIGVFTYSTTGATASYGLATDRTMIERQTVQVSIYDFATRELLAYKPFLAEIPSYKQRGYKVVRASVREEEIVRYFVGHLSF